MPKHHNVISINNQEYRFKKALANRGQNAFAGFYCLESDQSQVFLIKTDDPEICVLEGSASFSRNFIPNEHQSAINLAEVVTVYTEDGDSFLATKQKALDGYQPWDEIIYKRRRDPKALISDESRHAARIKESISKMSPSAKKDLAVSLFISMLVGDESLHVGQFMAKVKGGGVTGLCRIDLGARERYSQVRAAHKGHIHKTSKQYASSGQLGKEYFKYLVQNRDVWCQYLHLWLTKSISQQELHQLSEGYRSEMRKAINTVPQDEQAQTLVELTNIFFKKSAGNDYLNNARTLITKLIEANTPRKIELCTNLLLELSELAPKEHQQLYSGYIQALFEQGAEDVASIDELRIELAKSLLLELQVTAFIDRYKAMVVDAQKIIDKEVTNSLQHLDCSDQKDAWVKALYGMSEPSELMALCYELDLKQGVSNDVKLGHQRRLLNHLISAISVQIDNSEEASASVGELQQALKHAKKLLIRTKVLSHVMILKKKCLAKPGKNRVLLAILEDLQVRVTSKAGVTYNHTINDILETSLSDHHLEQLAQINQSSASFFSSENLASKLRGALTSLNSELSQLETVHDSSNQANPL